MTSTPVDTPVAPPSLAVVAARVEARLEPFLADEVARWSAFDGALADPLQALSDLTLAPAKRIRPTFCHWGNIAAGGDPDDTGVVDAGAAIELLQAFALIHDDVMDGSSVRRGRRTAHLTFADAHQEGTWRGEPRRYGEGVAILIGDLALVYADQFMVDANRDARRVWDTLRVELNAGQYLDLHGTACGEEDPRRTRRIARYKSGKYTVERPLHLGAALAGGLDGFAETLSGYGEPLGEAFQLRDDLLGAFGETAHTGKPVGDDLREGKPTTLLAEGLARAGDADRRIIESAGHAGLDDEGVARIQDVLVSVGAKAAIETRVDHLAAEAIGALDPALVDPEVIDALAGLAWYVAHRVA
ncbi:MAG: polyprenyl synthetase family protein [Actinobacteria bacterium]|nr:polyprenyl synthetase family protein [Actinomycetota bacterium]